MHGLPPPLDHVSGLDGAAASAFVSVRLSVLAMSCGCMHACMAGWRIPSRRGATGHTVASFARCACCIVIHRLSRTARRRSGCQRRPRALRCCVCRCRQSWQPLPCRCACRHAGRRPGVQWPGLGWAWPGVGQGPPGAHAALGQGRAWPADQVGQVSTALTPAAPGGKGGGRQASGGRAAPGRCGIGWGLTARAHVRARRRRMGVPGPWLPCRAPTCW
jgi:hypothetical protein